MEKPAPFPITEPLRIGDMHSLFGVSRRALRLYEAQGLIHADRTANNARRYDFAARDRVRWIVRLRRAGLGLGEIREILGPVRGGRREPQVLALARLATRADRLRTELAETEDLIRTLDSQVDPLGGPMTAGWRASRAAGG